MANYNLVGTDPIGWFDKLLVNSLLRNNKGFQSELRPTELRLTELRGNHSKKSDTLVSMAKMSSSYFHIFSGSYCKIYLKAELPKKNEKLETSCNICQSFMVPWHCTFKFKSFITKLISLSMQKNIFLAFEDLKIISKRLIKTESLQ